jgi:hypothetical protein
MTASGITDRPVHVVRPSALGMPEEGCTGFTMLRYAVPQWCRERGYDGAIYLDVDMLVLGDVAELEQYLVPGMWATLKDGSTEVSVISADVSMPEYRDLRRAHRHHLEPVWSPTIPLEWNCEDCYPEGAKLVHFTNLDTQPWWYDHPDPDCVALYESYCRRHGAEPYPRSN